MTMQSSSLLPALRELPTGDESGQNRSFRDNITIIVSMDQAMYAAEFAAGVSFGMWGVFRAAEANRTEYILENDFPETGIFDPYLQNAYAAHEGSQYADFYDPDLNVVEAWERAQSEGWQSLQDFYNHLKGKVAEFNARDQLNQNGYNLELAVVPDQGGWDLHGTDPNGEYVQIQVKTGASEEQVKEVLEAMRESEYYPFALGEELAKRVREEAPELADKIIAEIGPASELLEGIKDGLSTLNEHLGNDVLEGVGDIIPYASVIFASARLIMNIIKTERDFKTPDLSTKMKVQVVQTLELLSRMGPKTVMSIVGGKGGAIVAGAVGTVVGTVAPGIGNVIGGTVGTIGGGIGGAFAGYRAGSYLSKHLEPRALDIALNITGMTNDDLFYYKNKVRIDNVALSYQEQARALAAPT